MAAGKRKMEDRLKAEHAMSGETSSAKRGRTAGTVAVVLALCLAVPQTVSAMGSLPTGPSERGNRSEIAYPAGVNDMLPASLRLLSDRQFQALLEQEISAAREEVVICQHLFSIDEEMGKDRALALADLLVQTAARGVDVIVVLEIGRERSPITISNRRTARYLQERGVRVYADMSGTIVHARLAVIDRRLVFLGSHDLTHQSLGRYREASLLVDSPPLAISVLAFIESLDPVTYRERSAGR
jgi:phosphatidylserine/phosphatidylglycerophosphate/cardiolipin synthase-like enzyme